MHLITTKQRHCTLCTTAALKSTQQRPLLLLGDFGALPPTAHCVWQPGLRTCALHAGIARPAGKGLHFTPLLVATLEQLLNPLCSSNSQQKTTEDLL